MSITKVDKNKYRIFISDGFNLDGSRRRFSKIITTDLKGRDLERFLMLAEFDFEDEVKKRDPKFSELARGTFEAYSNWWLEYKEISDTTKEWYKGMLDTWILPYIGNKILDKLTTEDMLELMKIIKSTPSKKPMSVRSVKHYHTLLKNMFNTAVELKILNENPILPQEPIKYQLATLLTLSTGLRLDELSALQWKHIDKINCIVTVEQTNSYTNKESKIKDSTKNLSSTRKVSFPQSLVQLIEKHEEDEMIKKDVLG